MGKYGQVAELAAQLLAEPNAISPRNAWQSAVARVFPESKSSQAKGCPRDSFLALCEIGVVKNVPPGNYTRSTKNKSYVVRALEALRGDGTLSGDDLWGIVMDGARKKPNGQMDVVIMLFRKGLIRQ